MISPTLACANYLQLQKDIEDMDRAGVDFYHIDIMDGHYVPNICLNFEFIQAVKSVTATPLEVHLMVNNPLDYVGRLAGCGVEYVCAHIDVLNDNAEYFIDKVKRHSMKAGLVLSPEDSVQAVRPYLKDLAYVLVMCVKPGFSGQAFRGDMLYKVEELSRIRDEDGLDYLIEVDGGVGWENIRQVRRAGADVAVAGLFAIFGQEESLYEATVRFREAGSPGLAEKGA